jgi:hypothetical protein
LTLNKRCVLITPLILIKYTMGKSPEQNDELTAEVVQPGNGKRKLSGAEYKIFLGGAGITDAAAAIRELGLNVCSPISEGDECDDDADAFRACA